MPSIRYIINAATPGKWDTELAYLGYSGDVFNVVANGSDYVVNSEDGGGVTDSADARFIATFDPEHIALMEAERNTLGDLCALFCGVFSSQDCLTCPLGEWSVAHEALDTYRKERGLDG